MSDLDKIIENITNWLILTPEERHEALVFELKYRKDNNVTLIHDTRLDKIKEVLK